MSAFGKLSIKQYALRDGYRECILTYFDDASANTARSRGHKTQQIRALFNHEPPRIAKYVSSSFSKSHASRCMQSLDSLSQMSEEEKTEEPVDPKLTVYVHGLSALFTLEEIKKAFEFYGLDVLSVTAKDPKRCIVTFATEEDVQQVVERQLDYTRLHKLFADGVPKITRTWGDFDPEQPCLFVSGLRCSKE